MNENITAKTEVKLSDITPIIELGKGFRAIHKDYALNHDENRRERVIISECLNNADDFVSFVSEYKTPSTKVFYDNCVVKAVFNYPLPDKPDYEDSQALLNLSSSSEFLTLKQFINKQLSQTDFIMFLKQCEPYFSEGIDGVRIVEIAQNLTATTKVNSVNTNTKKTAIVDIEVKSGALAHVDLPVNLCVTLPLFKQTREILTEFQLELFYDVQDGAVLTTLKCWTFDEIIETATRDIVKGIVEKMSLPAYMV